MHVDTYIDSCTCQNTRQGKGKAMKADSNDKKTGCLDGTQKLWVLLPTELLRQFSMYIRTYIRTLQRQEDDNVICPPCHPPRRLSCELCHHPWLQIQILSEAASLFTACLGRIILCFALCTKSLSCKCMQHVLLVNTLLSILLLQLFYP